VSTSQKKDILQLCWDIQEVLQAASAGDYSKRCSVEITDSFDDNPLSIITPAINLLLDDLLSKERKRLRAEGQLNESIEELERKLQKIEEQAAAIRELSTPVMEIWDDVLVLPIVGIVDTRRSMDIMNTLLERIVAYQAKCVILDVTGVEIVDTKTADYLLKVVRAAGLLGTLCVLTGLSPAVAQTLVEIGADLREVTTLRNLKEGLRHCLLFLRHSTKTIGPTPS
jgi:rsbT co-antagonist protein RsbR